MTTFVDNVRYFLSELVCHEPDDGEDDEPREDTR